MATRPVTHILKNSQGDIYGLCNPDESWSPRSASEVIADLESGAHSYVVKSESGHTWIHVVDRPYGKCLRTHGDDKVFNSLDELPMCGRFDPGRSVVGDRPLRPAGAVPLQRGVLPDGPGRVPPRLPIPPRRPRRAGRESGIPDVARLPRLHQSCGYRGFDRTADLFMSAGGETSPSQGALEIASFESQVSPFRKGVSQWTIDWSSPTPS